MKTGREALVQVMSESGKWLLAIAFFLLPLNGLERVVGQQLGDLALVLCLLVATAIVLLRGSLPAVPRWLVASGLLFLGGFILSEVFPALDPVEIDRIFPYGSDSAALNLLKLLVSLVVLPVLVLVLAPNMPAIKLLVGAWVGGVTVSCAAAFLDASLGWSLESALAFDPRAVDQWLGYLEPPRYPGLTAHPNSLAISTVLVTPVLLAWIVTPRRLLAGFPLLVLFAWSVIFSGSRTGLVAFLLVLVASLTLDPRVRDTLFRLDSRQISYQAVVVAASVLILVIGPSLSPVSDGQAVGEGGGGGLGSLSGAERFDPSDSSAAASDFERREALSESLNLIGTRPVTGSGFELIQATHNIYLQPLLAGGLLGLAGFLVAWIGFLRTGFLTWRSSSGARGGLALALTISIGGYLVMGLLINGMLDRFLYLGPALLLALAFVVKDEWGPSDQPESGRAPPTTE